MNHTDATAPRWAAGAAFGAVFALCVLLALLVGSEVISPGAGMPVGAALGGAAVAGLLGGAGLGWALSRWGWVPLPPSPPQVPPVPGEEDPARRRAKISGWAAGIASGLLAGPLVLSVVALSFGALDVQGRSLFDAVLLSLFPSAALGTLVGVGVHLFLLRRGDGVPSADPGRPSFYTAPLRVRRQAARAIVQGRPTGNPPTDLAARDLALRMANERGPVPFLLIVFPPPFLLLLPGTLERIREDGFTPFVLLCLGLLACLTLAAVICCVLAVVQRKRARKFLALSEEMWIQG